MKKETDILLEYMKLRSKRIKQEMSERIDNYPEQDRESALKKLETRKKEIDRTITMIKNNRIEEQIKKLKKHFEEQDTYEKEKGQ